MLASLSYSLSLHGPPSLSSQTSLSLSLRTSFSLSLCRPPFLYVRHPWAWASPLSLYQPLKPSQPTQRNEHLSLCSCNSSNASLSLFLYTAIEAPELGHLSLFSNY
ncbi:hypothetical protein AMTRI_Chr04g183430 [Amborella trichopoda]